MRDARMARIEIACVPITGPRWLRRDRGCGHGCGGRERDVGADVEVEAEKGVWAWMWVMGNAVVGGCGVRWWIVGGRLVVDARLLRGVYCRRLPKR